MTEDPIHEGCSYGELIRRAVDRWPDRVALVDQSESVTYREFGRRVACVVEALAGLGIGRGDGIAQLSANRIDAFVVNAAASTAGIRYTPLHPLGAEDDQAYIIEDAEVAALIVDAPTCWPWRALRPRRVPSPWRRPRTSPGSPTPAAPPGAPRG
jgi:fatty-acyl-CoA synthase